MTECAFRVLEIGDVPEVVEAWNRSLEYDQITVERFQNLFLNDPNFDFEGAQLAILGGRIVGLILCIRRTHVEEMGDSHFDFGWIAAFFVDESVRGQGIGTELIRRGEAFLRSAGCRRVGCNGYAPYYIAPGVDLRYQPALEFLERRGYKIANEPFAMGMSLEGVETPQRVKEIAKELANEGVEVRWYRPADRTALLAFMEREFPYWYSSITHALKHGRDDILLATWRGEVVGFTQWENPLTDPPNGAKGRFGPFGVKAELRNKGIGAVIFYHLVEEVRQKGSDRLWFGWAGPRNLTFYERAGCVVERQFRMFTKPLV